jgi:hypothetical protein
MFFFVSVFNGFFTKSGLRNIIWKGNDGVNDKMEKLFKRKVIPKMLSKILPTGNEKKIM